MSIILDIREKIKKIIQKGREVGELPGVYLSLLIITIAFLGFGLGRWSQTEEARQPVYIQNILAEVDETGEIKTAVTIPPGGMYVGSRTSDKYHLPWCGGASRIKEENKIWFASKEEAEARGYTPASNCRGI